jgi:hypothetical protein
LLGMTVWTFFLVGIECLVGFFDELLIAQCFELGLAKFCKVSYYDGVVVLS